MDRFRFFSFSSHLWSNITHMKDQTKHLIIFWATFSRLVCESIWCAVQLCLKVGKIISDLTQRKITSTLTVLQRPFSVCRHWKLPLKATSKSRKVKLLALARWGWPSWCLKPNGAVKTITTNTLLPCGRRPPPPPKRPAYSVFTTATQAAGIKLCSKKVPECSSAVSKT